VTTTDGLEHRLQRIFAYPLDAPHATQVDERVHSLSNGNGVGASNRSGFALLAKHRLLAVSVASVPLTVVIVVAALVIGNLTAPPSAFAGWTARPTSTDPAVAEVVEDACRKLLHHPADDPNFERVYDEEQRRKISAWPDPATLPLVAQDHRGEVILAFFTDGHIYADCTIQQNGERGFGAIGLGELERRPFGLLRVVGGMTAEGSSDGVPPLRSVIGEAAAEVVSVIIEREEGEPVTATVRAGYFLAWWPSSADIVRITAYDEDGNALATLEGVGLR
jgi:hypothetical protein